MTLAADFTTVVALDRGHADQLETVWPTWARHRPEILARPLVLLCDALPGTGGPCDYWLDRLKFIGHPNFALASWDWPAPIRDGDPRITQRERMLTALVRLPPTVVQTQWWLKLDTDAVALRSGPWFSPDWFAGPDVMVSSPWAYGKPANVVEVLDRWADGHPELRLFPPLGHRPVAGSDIVRYSRIISWCCWLRTDFSRWASELVPWGQRLPVPSQDTFVDYVAQRTGQPIRKVKMKLYGWDHVKSGRTLRKLAALAMKQPAGARP